MTPQEAIKILMLSPCYWLLDLTDRKKLVVEYCATYNTVAEQQQLKKRSLVQSNK